MSKLEVKQIPGLVGRVPRQMISGRDGIKALNELCDGGTVRVRRGITLQHDAQVIRASGLLAGSALPEFNGGPGRYRRRSRSRQISGDLMNLRGCEAVLFLLSTTARKKRKKEANSEQRETCCTVYLDSNATQAWLNRVRLPGHGKLSSLFRGLLQQVESPVKDGVFRRKWARSEPGFFLGLGHCRRSLFIGRIRIIFWNGVYHFRWGDAFFHDRLAARIVVIRDREDQRRAIIERNELLLGGQTKSALANDITAVVRNNGGSQNFRGPRRRGVDQNGDGILPNDLF